MLFVPVLFLLLRVWTTIYDLTVYSGYNENDPYTNLGNNGAPPLAILGVSYKLHNMYLYISTHSYALAQSPSEPLFMVAVSCCGFNSTVLL